MEENEHARLLRTLDVVLTPAARRLGVVLVGTGPFAAGRRAGSGEPDLRIAAAGGGDPGAVRRAVAAAALATGLDMAVDEAPAGDGGENLVFGERRALSSPRRSRRPSPAAQEHGPSGLFS